MVNALSEVLEVEVARDRTLWKQSYARGKPTTKLVNAGAVHNRRGTSIRFQPDPQIFAAICSSARRGCTGCAAPRPICSAAWKSAGPATPPCSPARDDTPAEAVLHFPGGLRDSLEADIGAAPRGRRSSGPARPTCRPPPTAQAGRVEWAVAWLEEGDGFLHSYCNTVPTPQGGTHEAGFPRRPAEGPARLGRAARQPARRRRSSPRISLGAAWPPSSRLFIREPQFQGQTKEKLTSPEAARLVETALRDRFDHFLAGDPTQADNLLAFVIERAEERLRRARS